MAKPLFLDLFAGAGGMSEGFRKAGFVSAGAVEWDEMAAKTFATNHPKVPILNKDIANISTDELVAEFGLRKGNVEVICGGPPCQGFSLAGPRISDDPRNRLFLEFVRVVKSLQPRYFIFENVSGITSMKKGLVVTAILRAFEKLGYKCDFEILNAADYGVPQARPRFILIGTNSGEEPMGMPLPTHQPKTGPTLFNDDLPQYLTVWDAISNLPSIEAGEGQEETLISLETHNDYQKDRLGTRKKGVLYNHRAINHSDKIKRRYGLIPEGSNNSTLPSNLRTKKQNVFKLHRERPARTVTCNHRTDLLHPFIPRGTTVREAARLQSFDDDYVFFGNLTRKAKWVTQDDQVGNAVPPLLAKAIANHLRKK